MPKVYKSYVIIVTDCHFPNHPTQYAYVKAAVPIIPTAQNKILSIRYSFIFFTYGSKGFLYPFGV